MISRHIHRKAVVGCGCRLLMEQLAIRLGYQKTITKSLVIAVLMYCLHPQGAGRGCKADKSATTTHRRLRLAA